MDVYNSNTKNYVGKDEMDNITDPRPPLSEWILDAYNVLCTHSLTSDDRGGVQSVPREQALDLLCRADELAFDFEDANYALTRLLERGCFYEVDGEFRVTTPEIDRENTVRGLTVHYTCVLIAESIVGNRYCSLNHAEYTARLGHRFGTQCERISQCIFGEWTPAVADGLSPYVIIDEADGVQWW